MKYRKVEITGAGLKTLQRLKSEYLSLVLKLEKPENFRGETITYLHDSVGNSIHWGWSARRAELREALGLTPTILAQEILTGFPYLIVPRIRPEDLEGMIGRIIWVSVKDESTPIGRRLKITHYFSYPTLEKSGSG